MDSMVKVAVCDDEKNTTDYLKLALAGIFDGLGVENEIDVFYLGSDLCRAMEAGMRYDLIFLDIGFGEGEINGVEVGHIIREVHDDVVVSIVYISWEKRYADQLFEINTLDFMTKPLTHENIERIVKRFLKIAFATRWGGGVNLFTKKITSRMSHRLKTLPIWKLAIAKSSFTCTTAGKTIFTAH